MSNEEEGGGGGEEEEGQNSATPYGLSHRAFLQALLSRQTITYEEAKPLLAAILSAQTPERPTLPEDVTPEDFEDYINALQSAISPFEFEIRSAYHQVSKERIYAVVNTTSDALTQMATVHTPDEIAFVKRVIDLMFETYNTPRAEIMAVTSMQALKVAKPPNENDTRPSGGNQSQPAQNGLTVSQASHVLEQMVAQGWFELSSAGFYSCSPRTIMELSSWLHETYNDDDDGNDDNEGHGESYQKIKSCAACRDIVTVGQRCPNMICITRLHNHCVRNFFRAHRDSEKCPVCKSDWQDPLLVGERAATRMGGRRSTNATARRKSSGRTPGEVGEESDASGGAEN